MSGYWAGGARAIPLPVLYRSFSTVQSKILILVQRLKSTINPGLFSTVFHEITKVEFYGMKPLFR